MPASDDYAPGPLTPPAASATPGAPPRPLATPTYRNAAILLCEAIGNDLPRIIPEFAHRAVRGPWPLAPILPPRILLARLVRLIAEVALTDAPRAHTRELLHAAADYGFARFEQNLSERSLLYDFDVLRQILWHYIRDRTNPTGAFPLEAIIRVDHVLTLAAPASLRGFHRLVFEARGDWPAILLRLERDWTPLPPIP